MFDVLVIGGGAAGMSAALTLGRSCRNVLICDDGRPRNAVAGHMHGFVTRDGTPPKEMHAMMRAELQQYPSVLLRDVHIERVERNERAFTAQAGGEAFHARTVLLAMGVYDALPEIEGLRERWGTRVFVCPYCDAYELRGKPVAVLGKGKRAVELAQELYQWSSDLRVCMNGEDGVSPAQERWLERSGAQRFAAPLTRVEDAPGGIALRFSDGRCCECEAIFLCAPLRQRYPLVASLGCTIDGDGNIRTDAKGRTEVPGVYAAGDAVTSVHQVVLAAASGVCAGMAINEDLLAEDVRRLSQ